MNGWGYPLVKSFYFLSGVKRSEIGISLKILKLFDYPHCSSSPPPAHTIARFFFLFRYCVSFDCSQTHPSNISLFSQTEWQTCLGLCCSSSESAHFGLPWHAGCANRKSRLTSRRIIHGCFFSASFPPLLSFSCFCCWKLRRGRWHSILCCTRQLPVTHSAAFGAQLPSLYSMLTMAIWEGRVGCLSRTRDTIGFMAAESHFSRMLKLLH